MRVQVGIDAAITSKKASDRWHGSGFVFTTADGRPVPPSTRGKQWRNLRKRVDLGRFCGAGGDDRLQMSNGPVDIVRRHHGCGLAISGALIGRSGRRMTSVTHAANSTTDLTVQRRGVASSRLSSFLNI